MAAELTGTKGLGMTDWHWKASSPNPLLGYGVGVELSPSLSPEVLKAVSALSRTLAEDLPRKTEQQALMFQVGPIQPQPQVNLGGVVFDEIDRDGSMKRQLVVAHNSVMFNTSIYRRWAEFWPFAERMLKTVFSILPESLKISALVLTANNRFHWSGPADEIDYNGLIRRNCGYIAANVLAQRSLCHSFHGFVTATTDPRGKRVDNVNFASGDRLHDLTPVDLNFSFRLLLDQQEIERSRGGNADDPLDLESTFCSLHNANNRLFSEIIVPSLCDRVVGIPKL